MIHRPTWMADALCREYPGLSWFPGRGEDVTAVKAVCARCSVRDECLTYALDDPGLAGVWAGTASRVRQRLRRTAA